MLFFSACSKKPSATVKVSKQKVTIYQKEDEAANNAIEDVPASVIDKITIKAKKHVYLHSEPTVPITSKDNKNFTIDLTNQHNNQTILFTLEVGGDGSLVGKQLQNDDFEKYYLVIKVKNDKLPETETKFENTPIPTGEILIGDQKFQTYSSEDEASKSTINSQLTIPTELLENFTITCEKHSETTSRIWVKISMLDGSIKSEFNKKQVVLSNENDWTNTLNVKDYAGHQITLMIKAEDSFGITSSYQYISIKLPLLP